MPSSDYTNAVGGGLKLKGAKDAGVKKHRKKKTPNPDTRKADDTAEQEQPEGEASTSLHKALADEEVDGDDALAAMKAAKAEKKEEKLAETDNGSGSGSGKTEAQRRHEEMRRKRVCPEIARLTV